MDSVPVNQFSVNRWTKATLWGWVIGIALILIISSFLDSIRIEHTQFYLGIGMGTGVGLVQWFLLRKFIPVSINWLLFSIIGMAIPFIIFDLIPNETITQKLPFSIPIGALLVGFLQYTILKKHSLKAILWIIGSLLGWVLGVLTVFTIDYTNNLKSVITSNLALAALNLLLMLAGGIVLGIISGNTMKKILVKIDLSDNLQIIESL